MKRLCYLSAFLLSGCASHFAAFQSDSSRYDIALEEMRIEIGDLKQELHSARIEMQLLEERLEQAPVNKRDTSREELAAVQSRLHMLEKNQERALADLRALAGHAEQTSDALLQYRNRLQSLDTKRVETYRVKKGDSLEKIAAKHRTTVGKLKQLNRLESDIIVVDQELVITDGR